MERKLSKSKIFVAGKMASGKSTITRKIVEHTGFPRISFGDVLRYYSRENGLSQDRKPLQDLGQDIINRHGYKGFFCWVMEHSPHIDWNGPLIVDGLRHSLMYEKIIEMFPDTILVYCDCDEETQVSRIMSRDKIEKDEIMKIISHETEKYISELEPQAHIIYRPESDTEDIIRELDKMISGYDK